MTRSEARDVVLAYLQSNESGKATNSDLTDEIGGDEVLFQRVREDLILDDLAEDYKGAGLKYIGPPAGPDALAGTEDSEALEPSAAADGPASPRRIFLSYGRKDAEELARRLKEVLEQDGHTVWIDKSEIKSGRAWEAQIEEALHKADLAVTILSPHAVRRPEGVCLDEISFARYHGLPIVLVMAIPCTPPLGIYRLDWVDLQGWEEHRGRFQRALRKLREALHLGPNQSVEGTHADLLGTLQPIDFGPELVRLQKGFTGRDRVVEAAEDWLGDPEGPPAFLLTGDPLVLRGHESGVTHVAWSPTGDRLASASVDRTVRVWTLNAGGDPHSVERDRIPDSFLCASGAAPYGCRSLPNETCIERAGDESPVAWFEASGYSGLASSPDGSLIWAAHNGSSVLVFTLENPPLL